jgi:hypothetical protein
MRSYSEQSAPNLAKLLGTLCCAFLVLQPTESSAQAQHERELLTQIKTLNQASTWTLVSQVRLSFDTFHPQGMVKIGAHFFLSSVETTEPPARLNDPSAAFDRTPGAGVGHLFKFTADGTLAGHTTLGEGTIYHPGGIDFDGESAWVSVAEYRPNSRSIIYRVDPNTLASHEALRFDDHLGAIARDPEKDTLHALSWGSRRLYSWQGNGGDYANALANMRLNPSHYIDYQDCQYLTGGKLLCSGLSSYRDSSNASFKLGGIDVIDLRSMQPEFQLPVTQFTDSGALLTQNPFYAELNEDGNLMLYFVPEDGQSSLYGYLVQ